MDDDYMSAVLLKHDIGLKTMPVMKNRQNAVQCYAGLGIQSSCVKGCMGIVKLEMYPLFAWNNFLVKFSTHYRESDDEGQPMSINETMNQIRKCSRVL